MKVVNKSRHKRTDHDIYVARPSSLGNPFSHLPKTPAEFRVADRNEAIDRYEVWLEDAITNPSSPDYEAVRAALRLLSEDSILVCWCKPKRCHADVIVKLWGKYFRDR